MTDSAQPSFVEVPIPYRLASDDKLHAIDFTLYITLAQLADPSGRCALSWDDLAELSGLTKSGIRHAMNRLEDRGHIARRTRFWGQIHVGQGLRGRAPSEITLIDFASEAK